MFHVTIEISIEPYIIWGSLLDKRTRIVALYHQANASRPELPVVSPGLLLTLKMGHHTEVWLDRVTTMRQLHRELRVLLKPVGEWSVCQRLRLKHLEMLADVHWSQMKLMDGVIGKRMAVIEKLPDQSVGGRERERESVCVCVRALETLLAWKAIVATSREEWRKKFSKSPAASRN